MSTLSKIGTEAAKVAGGAIIGVVGKKLYDDKKIGEKIKTGINDVKNKVKGSKK